MIKENAAEPFSEKGRTFCTVFPALEEIAERILALKTGEKRRLVTLDGPCASGKTTLARVLAEMVGAAVMHTDDFVVPHALKTPERLAIPGGNCDAEHLVNDALAPWKAGLPGMYRRYDCKHASLLAQEPLPGGNIMILEGSYCNLPAIRAYADLCLFLDTPEEIRFARLRRRETPESLRRFREMWIPLENAYFSAYRLPDERCLIIQETERAT